MPELSPIESEFATTEEAEAYDRWFRAKIEARMKSTDPGMPHDEVMAEIREMLESKRRVATGLGS